MPEKKQLTDEQLEKINGGYIMTFEADLSKYSDYSKPISSVNCIRGMKYLFKKDNYQWLVGRYQNTCTLTRDGVSTNIYLLQVEDGQGYFNVYSNSHIVENQIEIVGNNYSINASEYQIYSSY